MEFKVEDMEENLWWGYKAALETLREHLPGVLEELKKQDVNDARKHLNPKIDAERICRAVRDMMVVEGVHDKLLYLRAIS